MRVLSAHDEVALKEVPILPRTHLVSRHENWFGCIYEEDKAELHDWDSVSNFTPREEKIRQDRRCVYFGLG